MKKTLLAIHAQEGDSKPRRDAEKACLTFSNRETKCLCAQLARIIQGSKWLSMWSQRLSEQPPEGKLIHNTGYWDLLGSKEKPPYSFTSLLIKYSQVQEALTAKPWKGDLGSAFACLSLKAFILVKHTVNKEDHLKSWGCWDCIIYLVKPQTKMNR